MEDITCIVCGCLKGHSEFYKRKNGKPSSKKCKTCYKKAVRENREKNKEYYLEYDRARQNRPDRVLAREVYSKGKGKEVLRKIKAKYIEKNKKKRSVHIKTGNAIRDGKLIKAPCEVCGSTEVVAHHTDYDLPLEVMWLCPFHHSQWHKENGEGLNGD